MADFESCNNCETTSDCSEQVLSVARSAFSRTLRYNVEDQPHPIDDVALLREKLPGTCFLEDDQLGIEIMTLNKQFKNAAIDAIAVLNSGREY